MKYSKVVYETTDFYCPDEEEKLHKQKIVKVRKEHQCCNCGENALHESCFLDGFPVHAYTCISCCDNWLDEIEEMNSED